MSTPRRTGARKASIRLEDVVSIDVPELQARKAEVLAMIRAKPPSVMTGQTDLASIQADRCGFGLTQAQLLALLADLVSEGAIACRQGWYWAPGPRSEQEGQT